MATILFIDDEEPVRASIRRFLERGDDHRVIEASDGRQALRLAEHEVVDLVITDINMPEMDGIEVVMELSRRRPGLPVIAISGGGKFPKEMLLTSAGLLGAVTTLAKPFELEELAEAVQAALAAHGSVGDCTR